MFAMCVCVCVYDVCVHKGLMNHALRKSGCTMCHQWGSMLVHVLCAFKFDTFISHGRANVLVLEIVLEL